MNIRRTAILYGTETVSMTKKGDRIGGSRIKGVAFFTMSDDLGKIRSEHIRVTGHIRQFWDKAGEARLRWFEHVWSMY